MPTIFLVVLQTVGMSVPMGCSVTCVDSEFLNHFLWFGGSCVRNCWAGVASAGLFLGSRLLPVWKLVSLFFGSGVEAVCSSLRTKA